MYGYLVMFRMLFKDVSLKLFEKIVQIWGEACWGRTELTDLGLKLGENIKSDDY